MGFAPVYPHEPIRQIGDDLFMARGSIALNLIMRITRNMAIVRQAGELTLINPIRLSNVELSCLDALGAVKNIVRLGAFHGLDDQFYMSRYQPAFWCQEGDGSYSDPPIDHVLFEGGDLPINGAMLFCFRGVKKPECVLRLALGSGVLLTCDAIQHYGDYSNNNLPARLVMPFIGFPKTTIVGPFWLKLVTPDGASLRGEFDRLLELEFNALLSAHGRFLQTDAHEAVRQAVERAFPN